MLNPMLMLLDNFYADDLLITEMQTADVTLNPKLLTCRFLQGLAMATHLKFFHDVPISRSVLVDIYVGLLDAYELRG
jgi:hypothetical protein